jgi:CyaY protein
MIESEFDALADAAIARIEKALDACDADFDWQLKPGGVLELEFSNGAKIVVNRHGAAREIWVAAKSGGFHYRYDGSRWIDTRGGGELFVGLSRLISDQAGRAIELDAS